MKTKPHNKKGNHRQTDSDTVFDQRLKLVSEAVRAYHQYLVRYACGIVKDWATAEDIVSKLWEYVILHVEPDLINHLPVLRRKVWFLAMDDLRFKSRRDFQSLDQMPDEYVLDTKSQQPLTDQEERHHELVFWAEMPEVKLTNDQKKAAWLHWREGYTLKECSARFNKSTSTMGDWITKARAEVVKTMNA